MTNAASINSNVDRLLTRKEVEDRVGLRRSAIYAKMRDGDFPEPLQLGGRTVRWPQSEIETWIAARPRSHGDGFYRRGARAS